MSEAKLTQRDDDDGQFAQGQSNLWEKRKVGLSEMKWKEREREKPQKGKEGRMRARITTTTTPFASTTGGPRAPLPTWRARSDGMIEAACFPPTGIPRLIENKR